jgi:hypothetical protein
MRDDNGRYLQMRSALSIEHLFVAAGTPAETHFDSRHELIA